MNSFSEIIAENARRTAAQNAPYNPVTGEGSSLARVPAVDPSGKMCLIPTAMADDELLPTVARDYHAWCLLRFRHDFEFWAVTCVKIKDKLSGRDVPFVLNRPQRRVLAVIEEMRTAGRPIRLIMLKARQWGGSTLVQMYMAWIQCIHHRNWNSLICAHVKDTAATIRGMYTKMLAAYPDEYWEEDAPHEFRAFERTTNIRTISGRDCRVTIGSAEGQEAVRGADFAMAHLSEVAFWRATPMQSPAGFIRAVCGGIARQPDTLIVLESTANGVGNYFHSEWMRSVAGKSDKVAVFVPWYDIEIYTSPVADHEALWLSLNEYEKGLWNSGCTLEQIQWYREKSSEYSDSHLMKAEFPSTDSEAFANTGSGVFAIEHIETLRRGCSADFRLGELSTASPLLPGAMDVLGFVPDTCGRLKVWTPPKKGIDRYVVSVDIGGRTDRADYSVICVIDRFSDAGKPEIVAQWRGHIDHDLLTAKAAAIATWYGNALLVVESNTLESEAPDADNALTLLAELNRCYRNLYRRQVLDAGVRSLEQRVGFHTNRQTKAMVINQLISLVRDNAYLERDMDACHELAVYECDSSGRYAARLGCHDDILMTRAIGLWVALHMDVPVEVAPIVFHRPKRVY
jgi:hypothetical protein